MSSARLVPRPRAGSSSPDQNVPSKNSASAPSTARRISSVTPPAAERYASTPPPARSRTRTPMLFSGSAGAGSRCTGGLPGTASGSTTRPAISSSPPTFSVRHVTWPGKRSSVRYRTLPSTKPRRTGAVAYTTSGCDSRSESRPRQWSRSPLVSRMAAIGESRGPRGCSAGKPSIWARISGEQLRSSQRTPSALTATHSCVRAEARTRPSRTPRQFGQPQFHCGKPPPAAEPRTRITMSSPTNTTALPRRRKGCLDSRRVSR